MKEYTKEELNKMDLNTIIQNLLILEENKNKLLKYLKDEGL